MSLVERVRRAATAQFWGRVAAGDPLVTWLHEPTVRRYVNSSISGDPNVWPMDALAPSFGPVRNALSLGCGDGTLDRHLRRSGLCESVTGIDISERSLEVARAKAAEEGLDGIRYVRGDFNALDLEAGTYDAAFFQQSLHHVEKLEGCLEAVAAALKPNGMLYLDEYIGPSRSQWHHGLLAEADAVYRTLPRAVRRRRRLALPVDRRGDPSEAVRSSEIVAEVSRRFEIETRRDYGGNFLSVIHPHLDLTRVGEAERDSILESIIAAERAVLAAGAVAYYTVIVARVRACPKNRSAKARPATHAV
jgi:2-polyprenyl-3-methyl-5-hydroxy-6-metoxy-1,4-benzoquinol methylase